MGAFVHDSTALSVIVQINARFGVGAPIEELVALQKEFKVFSRDHKLRNSFALINVTPPAGRERDRWYNYLDNLHKYPSDRSGVNGHDRVVQAAQENLESGNPLPMRLTAHSAKENPAVTVTVEAPIVFSKQEYVVVSVPVSTPKS